MKRLSLLLFAVLSAVMVRADGLPTPSTTDAEVWYQIRFVNSGGALSTNGTAICRTQNPSSDNAQWFKFVKNTDDSYTITSRGGLTLYANSVSTSGKIYAAASPSGTSTFNIASVSTGFELRPSGQSAVAMNQFGGATIGNNIGLWDVNDAGNAVTFVTEEEYAEAAEYATIQASLPLIPFPQQASLAGDSLQVSVATVLADVATVVDADTVSDNMGVFHFALDQSLAGEAYSLEISAGSGILIKASSRLGFINGVHTVRQLAMLADTDALPCLTIKDHPRFAHRGLMLDFSRHFFTKEEVLKVLDAMALYKMSRLHMHLTDDQGWRIEIPEYPLLTTVGAVRSGSLTNKGGETKFIDDTPYGEGCFFTLDELREIVTYAAKRGITCYPEVDLPGHMVAAITAYPELSCDPSRSYSVRIDEGISTTILNVAKPEVMTFLKTVFGHLAEVFPAPYFHLGGDECPTSDWQTLVNNNNAQFKQFMSDNGLTNVNQIQPWLVNELGTWLKSEYGKDVVAWDELSEHWDTSKYSMKPIIMAYRNLGYAQRAGALGFRSITCPTFPAYLDMMQVSVSEADVCEVYQGGYGDSYVNSLPQVYAINPTSAAGDYASLVMGGQVNLWAEVVCNNDQLEYQTFPRMMAMSELTWLDNDKKSYDSFRARMQHHAKLLEALDITYAKHHFDQTTSTLVRNMNEAKEILADPHPGEAGYPSQDAYDALQEAVESGKVTSSAYYKFKRAAINMPDPSKRYRIISASKYYKALYYGSSLYVSGDGLRIHYTKQIEPEEIFRFEDLGDGTFRMISVMDGRGVNISADGVVLDENGSNITIAATTKSSTGGNGVTYSYMHGAMTIKTGTYGLYARSSGIVNSNNDLAVCYPGTWFLSEITDYTAETEGLMRKCRTWLAMDSGEDGQPSESALAFLRSNVYDPGTQAVASGTVSEETYTTLLNNYLQFVAMPLKSYSEEIDDSYYYYIKNVWHGGYAIANTSTNKVTAGSRNTTSGLWGVFKNADGTVYIVPKRDHTLYVNPATIESGAELNLTTTPVKWSLWRGATDEASGVNILESGHELSWYSNGSGTQIMRPKAWGAAFWQFERSDVSTGIERTVITDTENLPVYDLQGRRVNSSSQHGVYIIGGNKVVK